MRMWKISCELTFTAPLLATLPANENVYKEFIASKAPDALTMEEEIERHGLQEVTDKQMTVFPRMTGNPDQAVLLDYQFKGFIKAAIKSIRRITDEKGKNKSTACGKLSANDAKSDTLIFIEKRENPIIFDGPITIFERPLRAETAQGPRVALAMSEQIPEGAKVNLAVETFSYELIEVIKECLEYGKFYGLLQWRNSGKGTFTFKNLSIDEVEC